MTKRHAIHAAAAVAIFGADCARADTPTPTADTPSPLSRLYVGAGAGYSTVYTDLTANIARLQRDNDTPGCQAAYGRIFAGYNVNGHIALELGFMQTREMSASQSGRHLGADVTVALQQRINGFDYSVLLRPSTTGWLQGLFGRFGGTQLTTANSYAATANGTAQRRTRDLRGRGWLSGVGYEYTVSKNLAVRGELIYYGGISGTSAAQSVGLGASLIRRF